MKMHFSSESFYTESSADKGYSSKMLAQNIVNNDMSARTKMREKNCNSEKKKSISRKYLKPGVQASTHDNRRSTFALYSFRALGHRFASFLLSNLLCMCIPKSIALGSMCYRFYMVDGKSAGTSSIAKAIRKLKPWPNGGASRHKF